MGARWPAEAVGPPMRYRRPRLKTVFGVTKAKRRLKQHASSQQTDYIDFMHNNAMEVFDGSLAHHSPLLKKGNVMSCSPFLGSVWIFDGDTHEIVWNWYGPWVLTM